MGHVGGLYIYDHQCELARYTLCIQNMNILMLIQCTFFIFLLHLYTRFPLDWQTDRKSDTHLSITAGDTGGVPMYPWPPIGVMPFGGGGDPPPPPSKAAGGDADTVVGEIVEVRRRKARRRRWWLRGRKRWK